MLVRVGPEPQSGGFCKLGRRKQKQPWLLLSPPPHTKYHRKRQSLLRNLPPFPLGKEREEGRVRGVLKSSEPPGRCATSATKLKRKEKEKKRCLKAPGAVRTRSRPSAQLQGGALEPSLGQSSSSARWAEEGRKGELPFPQTLPPET